MDGASAPVDVALEPGAALRLRVVDRDGRPVAGAGVGVETWRGRRILSLWRAKTDAEGLAAWADAPRDELRLSFYRAGSMSLRDVPVRASDEVHQVVLHPELVIAGKVVDAGTGEPIPKFRVVRGMYFPNQGEPAWQRGEAVDRTDGRYRERFSEPYEGWAVRIEAPGYKTAASRRFRPDEGAVVQDFALEPQAPFEGVVLRPDGAPAQGAEVVLAGPRDLLALEGRAIRRGPGTTSALAGPDGRFSTTRPDGAFRLVVASEHGYADVTSEQFAASKTIRLAPWGRVEGVLRLGGRPAAGETATLHVSRMGLFPKGLEAKADAEGRVVFRDVPPGPARIGRTIVTPSERGGRFATTTDSVAVEVAPGATTEVVVGGTGRPVVGRIVVEGPGDRPIDWGASRPVELVAETPRPPEAGAGRPRPPARFAGLVDKDGRFRVENVPPGAYRLQLPSNELLENRPLGEPPAISVPEGDRDQPVDLGDVTVKLDGPPKAEAPPERDEPAKTITVRVLDAEAGGPLEGARVEARSTPPGDGTWRGEATGGDGVARVGYRDDAPIKNFDLRVTKPGRVPAYVRLTDDRRPIELPASREFRLERGTTIGGVVTDESGAPVEGATVSVTMPMTELEAAVSNVRFPLAEAKTDARGRWRIDEAPADLGRVRVGGRHPRHLAASGEPSRDLDAVTAVLKKGQTVRGRVRGPDGAPIGGASVVVGDFFEANGPRGTTDAGGAFAIDRCRPGPTAVTVQAEGFAPQDRLVDVPEPGEEAPPLDFVLERGATLRLRVVDDAGRPVEGAYATVMGWHGRNGLRFMAKSDADGRVAWTSAPRDPISFQAGKDGYLAAEKLSLTASDEEHVFVLRPELKVVGRVTDAETGRPIPKFSVFRGLTVPGRTGVSWDLMQPLGGVEGRYVYKSAVPAMGHHLLIEAQGYKPAESRRSAPTRARSSRTSRWSVGPRSRGSSCGRTGRLPAGRTWRSSRTRRAVAPGRGPGGNRPRPPPLSASAAIGSRGAPRAPWCGSARRDGSRSPGPREISWSWPRRPWAMPRRPPRTSPGRAPSSSPPGGGSRAS